MKKKPMKTSLFKKALLMPLLAAALYACSGEDTPETGGVYTVTFDARGGTPVPEPQTVRYGELATEPSEAPVKEGGIFVGWFTPSGLKFNFRSNTIDRDITLHAEWWAGPEKYIFLNDYDWAYNYDKIKAYFGDSKGKRVAVGNAILIYIFERSVEVFDNTIRKHLAQSLEYEIPVLVELDPITFWNVPELWNWWDPNMAGYNPENRYNVEWSSWSPDDAVKIGWLNWGSQMRLQPMANLMSPVYQAAVKKRMDHFIAIVAEWYEALPADRKYLLGGIKVTGELALGVNNWYYPNGNSYLDKPESEDPQTGINVNDFPSRGVQTIGYAALKTAGIKTEGVVTGDDIGEVERRLALFVSEICAAHGIPRELIFAHAGGAGKDLESCLNEYACPSWSFYGGDATNPAGYSEVLNLMKGSDAPWFGIAEWTGDGSSNVNRWADPIREALAIDRCRFLSVFDNVVGNDAHNKAANMAAIEGIKSVQ